MRLVEKSGVSELLYAWFPRKWRKKLRMYFAVGTRMKF